MAGYAVAWEDVTAKQRLELDFAGQVNAIHRSQAVIEFELDGTISAANDVFLKAVGYSLDEVKGRHHGMFVSEAQRGSVEYREFWQHLAAGREQATVDPAPQERRPRGTTF